MATLLGSHSQGFGSGEQRHSIPMALNRTFTQSPQYIQNSACKRLQNKEELRLVTLESEKQPGLPSPLPPGDPGVGSSAQISTAKTKVI